MKEPAKGNSKAFFRKYKPYPAYKDSGVEWLGEVPESWGTLPIKWFARSVLKSFIDGDWIEAPYIRNEGIRLIQTGNIGIGKYREQGYRYIDEAIFFSFNCTEVMPGDVLICRLAEPVGRACKAPDLGVRMITSVDVCILKPSGEHDPRFITYVLSSQEYLSWVNSICRGSTRDRISRQMLGSIKIQNPLLAEQRCAANFLDRETAKIDALIEKQEWLIELLQEKRAALITHAVTKGLDPNVPMKDSGVKWLGEIPAHWEVKPLKRVVQVNPEQLPENTDPDYEFDYVEINDVDSKGAIINKESMRFNIAPSRARRKVVRDDIIISTVRTYLKAIALIVEDNKHDLVVSTGFAVLRNDGKRGVGNDFLWRMVQSSIFVEKVVSYSEGVSYPAITPCVLGSLSVWFPPSKEQNEIVLFLNRELCKVDYLIDRANKSIKLLKEYRTALISAAVTGKIDVRGEVSSA